MDKKVWLITGVSSGFGYELTKQILEMGDIVVGTVRKDTNVQDFMRQYPDTFFRQFLDVTDVSAISDVVKNVYDKLGKIDVVISNAGYRLFGAAEELTNQEIDQIIATNLTGSIQLIRSVLPIMRKQKHGRII